jgi:repressor LexA
LKLGLTGTPGEILDRLAKDHGQSLAALSRMLRRRNGYLATFVREGRPAVLAKPDRALLGAYFRVPEWWFGDDLESDATAAQQSLR